MKIVLKNEKKIKEFSEISFFISNITNDNLGLTVVELFQISSSKKKSLISKGAQCFPIILRIFPILSKFHALLEIKKNNAKNEMR